jgi:hypothetical protein
MKCWQIFQSKIKSIKILTYVVLLFFHNGYIHKMHNMVSDTE